MAKNTWMYHNLSLFSYDTKETARTADLGKRTVEDWNRQLNDKCTYYINGKSLLALRKEMLENGKCTDLKFSSVDELKNFFKVYIFQDVKNEQEREAIAMHACLQWHQAGIQHATYQHIWADSQAKIKDLKISLPEPKRVIHFNSKPTGAEITEKNMYVSWYEMADNGSIKKRHECDSKKEYYAETETTYEFTPEHIKLKDLTVQCPSENLKKIFDTRPERSKNSIARALEALIEFILGSTRVQPEHTPTNDDSQAHIFKYPKQ